MATFKWLIDYEDIIGHYIINDFRESDAMHYLNLEVHFKDSSQLFIKEFKESSRRKYSFHWQQHTGDLIVRWDNAPHFPKLTNFPHHKHLANASVESSYDIPIEDVLTHIRGMLSYSP